MSSLNQLLSQGAEILKAVERMDQRASTSDISTKKRQMEKANEKSAQNDLESFIEAVNTIADPFAILDQHYCFKYMTPGFAAFYNMTPEQVIGKNYWEAFPKLVGSEFYQNVCKVMNERVPVRFEWKAIYSEGWYEDHVHPLKDGGIVLYCRDISIRKRTELALRQSEEKFQKIFRNSPDMMIIFKANNFEIVEVNQRFVDLLGFGREELISRCLFDLDSIWGSVDKQEIMDELRGQTTMNNKELELVTKAGEKIITLISTDIINIEGDTCYLSVIKNITNEKKLEAKIALFEQLHLIGEMAAGIGHEVRNPMTTVKGFLQLFLEKPEFVNYRDRLNLMIDELDRANGIVSEFLALSRYKTSVQKKQQLNDIISAIFPLLQADAIKYDKYIDLQLGEVPELMLDEKEIRQVIHNLVRNGLEAIQPGQFVKIKTYRDGTEVILEVSDEGHGMDPEVMEKAGTPFFTTKDTGTGMGLPICLSIAERHNALIEIDSSPSGTTVYVRFKIS